MEIKIEIILIGLFIFTSFLGIHLLFKIYMSFKKSIIQKEELQKRIEHLYSLVTILNNGSCSPIHRLIFSQIYKTDIDNLNGKLYSDFESLKKTIVSTYTQVQKSLTDSLEKTTDFDKKIRIKKRLTEIQNILNLSNVINEHSSNEHIKTIIKEINYSMIKISKNNHYI